MYHCDYQAHDEVGEDKKAARKTDSSRYRSLEIKVDRFLAQLQSTQPDDISLNSEIFGDLLVHFAATFKTDVDKLVDVILEDRSEQINMATLRTKLTDLVSRQ